MRASQGLIAFWETSYPQDKCRNPLTFNHRHVPREKVHLLVSLHYWKIYWGLILCQGCFRFWGIQLGKVKKKKDTVSALTKLAFLMRRQTKQITDSEICPGGEVMTKAVHSGQGRLPSLPDPGIKPTSSTLEGGFFIAEPPRKSKKGFSSLIFLKSYITLQGQPCQAFSAALLWIAVKSKSKLSAWTYFIIKSPYQTVQL